MITIPERRFDEVSPPPVAHPLPLFTMPRRGRQRPELQKTYTAAMQKQRWLPKPPAPEDRRLLSKERKKRKRELERAEINARKREQRLREKLKKAEQESRVQTGEASDGEKLALRG